MSELDLLVLGSHSYHEDGNCWEEQFGHVLIEAMACGTPVAAFPVEGPREVLGAHEGAKPQGGVLDEDLLQACQQALRVPRHEARQRAMHFTWETAAEQFVAGFEWDRCIEKYHQLWNRLKSN